MAGSDPIVDALRGSVTAAAKRIRPKARSTGGGSGIFGSGSVSVETSNNVAFSPQRQTFFIEESDSTEIQYEVVLPDSDRARQLSRKERQVRKRKRRASKASKRKNRKRR